MQMRSMVLAGAAVLGFLAGCAGGASAPEPFTVGASTVSDAELVRSAFEEYASQWRELLAVDQFRYDTGAGVAQNMTTSETALVAAVPSLVDALNAELAAYQKRAGSSADELAITDVEDAVSAMTAVAGDLPAARAAVLACYLAATVDDECVVQQDRLSALVDYFEEAFDSVPLVPGTQDPEDSVA